MTISGLISSRTCSSLAKMRDVDWNSVCPGSMWYKGYIDPEGHVVHQSQKQSVSPCPDRGSRPRRLGKPYSRQGSGEERAVSFTPLIHRSSSAVPPKRNTPP